MVRSLFLGICFCVDGDIMCHDVRDHYFVCANWGTIWVRENYYNGRDTIYMNMWGSSCHVFLHYDLVFLVWEIYIFSLLR